MRLIPCMGVLEADEGEFLFKLFRYSSDNIFLKGQFFGKDLFLFWQGFCLFFFKRRFLRG